MTAPTPGTPAITDEREPDADFTPDELASMERTARERGGLENRVIAMLAAQIRRGAAREAAARDEGACSFNDIHCKRGECARCEPEDVTSTRMRWWTREEHDVECGNGGCPGFKFHQATRVTVPTPDTATPLIDALREAIAPEDNTGVIRFDPGTEDYRLAGSPYQLFQAAAAVLCRDCAAHVVSPTEGEHP